MERFQYIFQEIHFLASVDIFCYRDGKVANCNTENVQSLPPERLSLLKKLMERADCQTAPVILQDEFQVLFACFKKEDAYFFMGPIGLSRLGSIKLNRFYTKYGDTGTREKKIPIFVFSRALALIGLMAKIILDEEYSLEMLIKENHMAEQLEQNVEHEKIIFQMEEDRREAYHHTYSEERELLACVKEGRVEDALTQTMLIDVSTGRMSKTEIVHWKNVVIVAVTLCTRAAIEGGLSPKEAYQLSDFYLQKSDECKSVSEYIACRNRAIRDLTERVKKKIANKKSSNYVDRCKDYIEKHYREKIYLEDIGEALGVSSTHLSHVFSKETGMRLQDYITQFRLDKAANMLIYSDESIANIAVFVNFPSQSYFGNVFKKYKKMTPKEYRELYKTNEAD